MFSAMLVSAVIVIGQGQPPPKLGPIDRSRVQFTPGVRTYDVTFAVLQGDGPNGKAKPRVLANPSLMVSDGAPARFAVGGEVQAKGLDGPITLPTGVTVSVRIKGEDNQVRVHITAEEQSAAEDAKGNVQASSKGAKLLGTVNLGEKQTLELGDKGAKNATWIEMTIKEIKPLVSQ
jgi:hypothetical protein